MVNKKLERELKKVGIEVIGKPPKESKLKMLLSKAKKGAKKYGGKAGQKVAKYGKQGISYAGKQVKAGAKYTGKTIARETRNFAIKEAKEMGIGYKDYKYDVGKKSYQRKEKVMKSKAEFTLAKKNAEAKGWKYFYFNGKKYPIYTKTKTTTKTTQTKLPYNNSAEASVYNTLRNNAIKKNYKWFMYKGKKQFV